VRLVRVLKFQKKSCLAPKQKEPVKEPLGKFRSFNNFCSEGFWREAERGCDKVNTVSSMEVVGLVMRFARIHAVAKVKFAK
jgi:hypothetical protein